MAKSYWKVPFLPNGDMCGADNPEAIYEDRYEFFDELVFIEFVRGRSAIKARFMRITTGTKVEMFLSDFEKLLIDGLVLGRKVTGNWGFVKHGANYGIAYIPPVHI